MTSSSPRILARNFFGRLSFVVVAVIFTVCARAQTENTGRIEGRVVNQSSGNYLGNARIEVVGTTIETLTNERGEYILTNVPSGPRTVSARIVGLEKQVATVTVTPGQVTRKDFEISIRQKGPEGEEKTIMLEEFTVVERELNAQATYMSN